MHAYALNISIKKEFKLKKKEKIFCEEKRTKAVCFKEDEFLN